jgi:GAF domain-containing protein
MTSQWAAVGAETDPLRRARQLQKSWEHLLADGGLGPELSPGTIAGLRPTIVESWRRSLATGLDPTDLLAPIEADETEVLGRWLEHPLGSLTHVLTHQLRKVAEESRSIVVVTDASGLVLHRVGDESLKERAAEMNLVEGARYSEAADGTNGIGTALAADHAYQVFAFEHFNERHHEWTCSGAPVHDPLSGQTIGLIDLSSLWKNAHPRSLELVTTAARTIEQHLVDARRERDARLRRRYSDFMTRSTDLLVDRDGYVLDGAELPDASPFDLPEGGGELLLRDGSVGVAAPLGRGEAYLVREGTARHARSGPPNGLERAEERARELAVEQAALRHVATLVASGSSPEQLFAVVTEQVARILDVPHVRLVLYEPDSSLVVGGFSKGDDDPFPMGSRWPLDGSGVTATVRQTGRPARVEDYTHMSGEIAAVVRGAGMRSAVATPIVVERRLWGAMVVLSPRHEPLPVDTEARLTDFTELVATAIANAESREALARLAEEQAALRRVATLVASGTGPHPLFAAVAAGVQELLGAEISAIVRFGDDGTVVTVGAHGGPTAAGTRAELDPDFVIASVRETRRAARFDTDDPAAADMPAIVRDWGIRSAVASPIVVEGELWGAIVVGTVSRSLPPETERRLGDFTGLVATAVANSQARNEVTALADEQAALRRVATLVAQGTAPAEIFAAVSAEVDRVFGLDPATFDVAVVGRFEPGPELVIVGISKSVEVGPLGSRWPPDDLFAPTHVLRTGRSARIRADDVVSADGEVAELLRHSGYLSQVASPIVVDGRLWGAMLVTTGSDLPPDTEERLAQFTELVATAIANAESRESLAELADEQAALRRVATLVARGAQTNEVFWAVSDEVGRLFGTELAAVGRFEADGRELDLVGAGRTHERWEVADFLASAEVFRTGRSARADAPLWESAEGDTAERLRSLGIVSTVASPVVVEGELWGAMLVASTDELLPAESEERLKKFTDLVATAIANAESREARAVLTEEQAALRRVATLVAQAASPHDLFEAVAEEVGRVLPISSATMGRFEPDASVTVVASWSATEIAFPTGRRWPTEGTNIAWMVLQTGRAARIDDFSAATDPIGVTAREAGVKSAVGSPIVVEGHVWGVMTAASTEGPLPPGTETRLTSFTELVATAISNAESSAELAASRRRIVAAADDARRRIERDLHDGIQQRLIALTFRARAMTRKPPDELPDLAAELSDGLKDASDELREVSRGIHPTILTEAGLGPALRALARRSDVPIDVNVSLDERLPAPIEAAAYYIASEALTNVAKHAHANVVELTAAHGNGVLTLQVRDDGIGGVDAGRGSGILGLTDRVEALGGTISIASPPRRGTTLSVHLPVTT